MPDDAQQLLAYVAGSSVMHVYNNIPMTVVATSVLLEGGGGGARARGRGGERE